MDPLGLSPVYSTSESAEQITRFYPMFRLANKHTLEGGSNFVCWPFNKVYQRSNCLLRALFGCVFELFVVCLSYLCVVCCYSLIAGTATSS